MNSDGVLIADDEEVTVMEETLIFLYDGSGTQTTYTWTPEPGVVFADVLVVAGGGGGGSDNAGGGGGGGVIQDTINLTSFGTTYPILVGKGGRDSGTGNSDLGENGEDSSAFGFTAIGGGRGANGQGGSRATGDGGSGGGGQGEVRQENDGGGLGTPGQGFNGGNGRTRIVGSNGQFGGGGGGGATEVGQDGENVNGGDGGQGLLFLDGRFYGSGGAGGGNSNGTAGGGGTFTGKGLKGLSGQTGRDGENGSGGGGGGSGGTSFRGGAGGSGIVIIRPNPGALDGLNTSGITCAYALRRLFGGYAGPHVRIRRGSDNTQLDVSFDKYGYASGFKEWLGAATAFVVTWYDQSGNGFHGTTGLSTITQPSIAYTGSTNLSILFNGTTDGIEIGNTAMLKGFEQLTAISTFKTTMSTTGLLMGKHRGGTDGEWYMSTGNSMVVNTSSVRVNINPRPTGITNWDNTWRQLAMVYNGTALRTFTDGIFLREVAQTGTVKSTNHRLSIGVIIPVPSEQNPYWHYNGEMREALFFSTGLPDTTISRINSILNPIIDPIIATGGTLTEIIDGGDTFRVHMFTTSSTFTVSNEGFMNIIIIGGGGGGGGGWNGGGGGAGGLIFKENQFIPPGVYSVIIGAGGVGGRGAGVSGSRVPQNGSNSNVFGLNAFGGGSGAQENQNKTAQIGGSGGAGVHSGGVDGADGITHQGNKGGDGHSSSGNFVGGGGGGAGTMGTNATSTVAGNGGTGLEFNGIFYAGGGGGARRSGGTQGSGGTGGGGNGGLPNGSNGVGNTGGGGGAGAATSSANGIGGDGGSGIVIIRYRI